MMPFISVVNLQKKYRIPSSRLNKAAACCAGSLELSLGEVTIVCVAPGRMRRMNKEFLGHDYVTDVITFDSGDIVICPETASRFGRAHGQTTEEEMVLYVIHGMLHLAGYKDKKPKDIMIMRAMEKKMLAKL